MKQALLALRATTGQWGADVVRVTVPKLDGAQLSPTHAALYHWALPF